jgi:hypothetical protein
MGQTFTPDFKSCAVCNFWEGARELNPFRDQITVDSLSVRGKCLLQEAPWKGWDMRAAFFCSKWAKWAAVK